MEDFSLRTRIISLNRKEAEVSIKFSYHSWRFVTVINILLNSSDLILCLLRFRAGNTLNTAHIYIFLTWLVDRQMIKVHLCTSDSVSIRSTLSRLDKCQTIAFLYIFNKLVYIFLLYMSRLSLSLAEWTITPT